MHETAPSKSPAGRKSGFFLDVGTYFLSRPAIPTLIELQSVRQREDYGQRIMQRIGADVSGYRVLNVHRVGIDAPVSYVFEEAQNWGQGPTSWPNWIATLEPVDADPPHIEVRLFGGLRRTYRLMRRLFGPRFGRLFRLTLRKRLALPDPTNFDNARYLYFECSGGYPIGIMAVYVRSPIAHLGETEQSQVFLAVGFDFYGHKDWPRIGLVNRIWEAVHNRVTGNVLNGFKRVCEERCRQRLEGVLSGRAGG